MVFTPADYGVSSDVRGLADVAHAHDVPLITDDAEVAILDANRPRRAFRRITGATLERLLPEHNGSESESDSAE